MCTYLPIHVSLNIYQENVMLHLLLVGYYLSSFHLSLVALISPYISYCMTKLEKYRVMNYTPQYPALFAIVQLM